MGAGRPAHHDPGTAKLWVPPPWSYLTAWKVAVLVSASDSARELEALTRKNEVESWMPGRGAYAETHSCSTLGEFQARRSNIRLRMEDGSLAYPFTLNNTGALGAVLTEAIINQPQAAIMTMDLVVKRPVVVEGDHIVIRPIMNLGMSFDHRINDGLQATRFVRTVKDLLETFDDRSPL